MAARSALATVATVAGSVGFAWFLAGSFVNTGLGPGIAVALVLPAAVLAIAACAALCAGADRATAAIGAGLPLVWPVAAVLALLPAADLVPAPLRAYASGLLLLVATMLLTWLHAAAGGAGILTHSGADPASRLWRAFLLAFVLAMGVAYVAVGAQTRELAQNDGAYYYGMARHLARTLRFEEPLVWHFLHTPAAITHPPFDYWGCLTALLLVPSLWLFGATPAVAAVTMSVLSAATLLGVWYLACVALPLRHWATQLLAVVLFAFAPAMVEYRFQPESITVAQLAMVLALIAFARRHYAAAVVCAFGILLSRGDGLILFLIAGAAALLAAWREPGADRRGPWRVLAAGLLCTATYVGWSWVSFGSPTPPAPRALPFLASYWQVFDYGVEHPTSWRDVLRWFQWSYLAERVALLRQSLPLMFFTPHPSAWVVLVVLSVLTRFRGRPPVEALIWTMAVGGFLTVVWISGPGFYVGRGPAPYTPLIILAGAMGLDAVLVRLAPRVGGSAARRLLLAAGLFALCLYFVAPVAAPGLTPAAARPRWRPVVGQLDPILGGEPVASNLPWYVLAYTDSPTVSIPYNGEAAVEAVLERYGVRWLVLFARPIRGGGDSKPLLQALVAGRRTTIGDLRVERVPAPEPLVVFRILPPA